MKLLRFSKGKAAAVLISCPHCHAEYDLPGSLIGNGRKVRCAVCRNPWMAAMPEAPVEPAVAADPPPGSGLAARAQEETARVAGDITGFNGEAASGEMWPVPPAAADVSYLGLAAPRPPSRNGAALAWLATFAVLAAAVVSAWRWQVAVIAFWPPSQRLFDQVAEFLNR